MKKIILILVLLVVLTSCKKADAAATEVCDGCFTFYFQNPQPDNDSELICFPDKFKGLYRNSDSIFIRIEDDRILKEYFFKFKVHRQKMDSLKSEYNLADGKLITKDTKDKFDIKVVGDSIELSQKIIDTLFRLSYNQKVKRISGQLVLSTRDSVFWTIQTIALEKDILKIRHIYLKEDLKKLDSVTVINSKMLDSTSYLMKPTRREFKDILKIKNLGTNLQYDKVLK